MDYQRLNNERITATEIGSYDMITAVTQRAINKQLEKMHQVNESLQKLSLISNDPDDDFTRLDGELAAPTIELRLNQENRIVIFCLNIARATLKYLRIKGREVFEESLEIPASTLALSVNLSFGSVDFDKLPQDVKDRLKVLNDYSVQQLLIDFTSANLARLDPQRTTVNITDLTAKSQFDLFMNKYFTVLSEKHEFVLHYIPLVNQEYRKKYQMPTVPPTNFTFQNMPFIEQDRNIIGPSENNMLVYLQMCNNHDMPNQLLPNPAANWIVPTPDDASRYDGTVVLSANIFLNGWLLKRLSDFNRSSTWIVTQAWWKMDGLFGTEFLLKGKLGRTDASEDDVKWNIVKDADVEQRLRDAVSGQVGQWYKYHHPSNIDDNHGAWRVRQESKTTNWLFIPEGYANDGKCKIYVCGNTFVECYVHVDIPSSTGSINAEWSTWIVLDGVNDGELIINANDIKPIITKNINEAPLHGGDVGDLLNLVEDGLNGLSMTSVINEMRSVFTNGWDFVLPGAADFVISRAVFNREKDLMCELTYKFKA